MRETTDCTDRPNLLIKKKEKKKIDRIEGSFKLSFTEYYLMYLDAYV